MTPAESTPVSERNVCKCGHSLRDHNVGLVMLGCDKCECGFYDDSEQT